MGIAQPLKPGRTEARESDVSLRQAAWTAGLGLLVMSVLSPVAFFAIFPRLIDLGNMERTVGNITAHPGLFLAGIGCYLITFIADVIVAWGLYVFLRRGHPRLSLLTAWFRVVYAALALATLSNLVTVLRLVQAPDVLANFGAVSLHAQVRMLLGAFRYGWGFSMMIFSVHLLLLGALVLRSRHVPRILGILLLINGLGYLVDSLRPYLFPGTALPFLPVLFFGELIFMLWLLIWGTRMADLA